MILKHIDGTETDTDKLTDLDAIIAEKSEEFRDTMCQLKVPFSLVVFNQRSKALEGGVARGSTMFYNFLHPTQPMKDVVTMMAYRLSSMLAWMTGMHVALVHPDDMVAEIARYVIAPVPPPNPPPSDTAEK